MQELITQKIQDLPIWKGDIVITPLHGGITNVNMLVQDEDEKYVVRLGDDILAHHVMRFNERAASLAAHAAGLSPAVVHTEPGIMVLEHIDSITFTAELVRKPANLEKILTLIKSCHQDVATHLRGPALIFWVFHVVRDYAAQLQRAKSNYLGLLTELLVANSRLEKAVDPISIVFSHNDLLAGNILDDGERLWLIDWDYAGFNSPLFDLGGLASNNELSEKQEHWLLENYLEAPLNEELLKRYHAMKCASLLRETLWSMVSELNSEIDFDYAAYSAENLGRFQNVYSDFLQF